MSYIAAQGRCRGCDRAIAPIHVIGEIAGAIILPPLLALNGLIYGCALFGLAMLLMSAAIVDFRAGRVPNVLVGIIALLGAGFAAFVSDQFKTGIVVAVTTLILGWSVWWLTTKPGGGAGLGLGDVKLAAALGLWLGALMPLVVGIASILALSIFCTERGRRPTIAFAPLLGAGAFCVVFAAQIYRAAWL